MKPTFKNRPNASHKVGNREIWESRSPAVVGIIFAFANNNLYVLAEKRSKNMPDEPGKWVVPCGYMDWDESGWDALRREIYEETSFFIDKFKKNLVYDNDKEPFFVKTTPDENRQNIAINYCLLFDFEKTGLPKTVEKYKDHEVDQVKWVDYKEIDDYPWGFEHEKRIEMALKKCEILK